MRGRIPRFRSLRSVPTQPCRHGRLALVISVVFFLACPSFENTPTGAGSYYRAEKTWGRKGSGPGDFRGPMGIAVGASGGVYVADAENSRVQKFTSEGDFLLEWSGPPDTRLEKPVDVAVDQQDNVYVADYDTDRIYRFTTDGELVKVWGENGEGPGGVPFSQRRRSRP